MRDYEFLEHTADIKFRARGLSIEEVFKSSARAISHAILGKGYDGGPDSEKISVKSADGKELLHDFLSEILYLIQYEGFIPTGYWIKISKENDQVDCVIKGFRNDPLNIDIEQEVKAVTYHEMVLEKNGGVWIAEVICDT